MDLSRSRRAAGAAQVGVLSFAVLRGRREPSGYRRFSNDGLDPESKELLREQTECFWCTKTVVFGQSVRKVEYFK